MPRGGARPGSGPKKGARYRKRARSAAAPAGERGRDPSPEELLQALKRHVALLVAAKMSYAEISAATGIEIQQLREQFAHELRHGSALVKAEELRRLDVASASGKVAASKLILEEIASGLPPEPEEPADPAPDRLHAATLRILNGGKA